MTDIYFVKKIYIGYFIVEDRYLLSLGLLTIIDCIKCNDLSLLHIIGSIR